MAPKIPALSPSTAFVLLNESPLHAWAAHRLLGNQRQPSTESQEDGTLWHAAIIGGNSEVEVINAKDFRSNDAKELRDDARAAGKTPIVKSKWAQYEDGAGLIRAQLKTYGIDVTQFEVEKAYRWVEPVENGDEVVCSGRIDLVSGGTIMDLKTTKQSVVPRACEAAIARGPAILQDTSYRNAVHEVDGIERSEIDVVFPFVQVVPPYAVTPMRLSGEFRRIAEIRWDRAVRTWHRCLSAGRERACWPAPVDQITTAHPPGWLLSQELELEAQEEMA